MSEDPIYLSDVLLLCCKCKQPIKARITTSQWIKVEWISPDGECQACYQQQKQEAMNGKSKNNTTGSSVEIGRFTQTRGEADPR